MGRSTNANLGITILGNYKAGPDFKRAANDAGVLHKQVDGLAASFKDYVVGFGAVAGAGFVFSEAEEAEQIQRQTEAAIKSTGNAAHVTAEQQGEMVDQLSKLAGLDDEVVAGAANILRSFTNVRGSDIFEGALDSAADLAAVYDTDLEPQIKAIGVALNDPVAGLGKLAKAGTQFSASQKAVIKSMVETGDVAGAQRLILAELENQYGGQAEAASTASERTKVAVANTAEAVGLVLLPALEAGSTAVGFLADQFAALPQPAQQAAVAGLGLAVIGPRIVSAFKGAGDTLDFFRLGLAGATDKGAGFANTLGGLISKAGGLGPVMGIAGAAVGILAIQYTRAAEKADRLRSNAESLRQELVGGADFVDAFSEKLALTLNGVGEDDGGFDTRLKNFDRFVKAIGLSNTEIRDALVGTDAEFEKFINGINDAAGSDPVRQANTAGVVDELESLRTAGQRAVSTQEAVTVTLDEFGVASDEAADSTGGLTSKIRDTTSAMDRYISAIQARQSKLDAERQAEASLVDARDASAQSLIDLAEAQQAADGNSEASVQAAEAITSAREAEADAAVAVVDAQGRLTDAQGELNDAYAEAIRNLVAKAQAAREAADAELSSQTAVLRAQKELERLRAGGADALTIQEAQDKVREAQTAAAGATIDATEAAQDNAAAQRAGVEGDAGVVAAKEAIAEANRGIVDAEGRVQDARRATSKAEQAAQKVITDAKAAVKDATEKAEQAALDEAQAAADVASAQGGAAAGTLTHIAALDALRDRLAPGSPLRSYLDEYIAQLMLVLDPSPSGLPSLGVAPPGAQNAERRDTGGSGRSRRGGDGGITQNFFGTPASQRRAMRESAEELGDELARGAGG